MRPSSRPTIAVALHDVEPATFERCALIRDWLDDHGITRVTLLVIPARDLHPLNERSPEMASWLRERRRAGDSIAQHGFQHEHLRRVPSRRALARMHDRRAAEFVGLDPGETRRAVEAGWRVLKLAGIEPDGFVAPAYAYTPQLRRVLPRRFRWWAGLLRLHSTRNEQREPVLRRISPAWSAGGDHVLQRLLSPAAIRAGSLLSGQSMRLDLHPGDFDHPRHTLALQWVLARASQRREPVTYEQILTGVS